MNSPSVDPSVLPPAPRFELSSVPVAVRWTIGDVAPAGFEALRYSVWGARRVFGPEAPLVVCVNSVPLARARFLTGELPRGVMWHDATRELPDFLRPHLDAGMAEGVGWRFAPLRLFPHRYEIALDNDCILWSLPPSMERWLDRRSGECLVGEDVRGDLGRFAEVGTERPLHPGLRGLPPGFDFAAALQDVLRRRPGVVTSELDGKGLEGAALSLPAEPEVVTTEEVTLCSPFPPHQPHLGACGAHFVGLNARHLPWDHYGRPATEVRQEHWRTHRKEVAERVGLEMDSHPFATPVAVGRALEGALAGVV